MSPGTLANVRDVGVSVPMVAGGVGNPPVPVGVLRPVPVAGTVSSLVSSAIVPMPPLKLEDESLAESSNVSTVNGSKPRLRVLTTIFENKNKSALLYSAEEACEFSCFKLILN